MKRISLVFGTRPEAIKLCPLILALREHGGFKPHVCVTGQHRELLDQVLKFFQIRPDCNLALMRPSQTLAGLTSRAIAALDVYLADYRPDLVLVQGDTSSAFCAALAAFYRRLPVGHVEAGLRTGQKYAPYPEELNRTLVTRLADYHFAPTPLARANLLRDGVPEDRVFLTGNTVIDALKITVRTVRASPPNILGLPPSLTGGRPGPPMVLITGHRRENFGDGILSICKAIATLAERFRETAFVFPVHPNPNIREPVFRLLKGRPNVHLIEPVSYPAFVSLMDRCRVILTDSGGVQEEAPSLGKPVLVMRAATERPEGAEGGAAQLVAADCEGIVAAVSQLLLDPAAYERMACVMNPYGDGRACQRIVEALARTLIQPAGDGRGLRQGAAREPSEPAARPATPEPGLFPVNGPA